MKPRTVLIIPVIMFFLAGLFLAALPGGAVGYYLLGALLCLAPVGFSGGWSKWMGMALCLAFLFQEGRDHEEGMARIRKEAVEDRRRVLEKNLPSEGEQP